jgi:hypothetical protein
VASLWRGGSGRRRGGTPPHRHRYCYTAVTLLLHYCYTVVTLWAAEGGDATAQAQVLPLVYRCLPLSAPVCPCLPFVCPLYAPVYACLAIPPPPPSQVGVLAEAGGKPLLAHVWYGKAMAQGLPVAMVRCVDVC